MAHILIAEDDIEINKLIARNLKLIGHTYLQAFDGNDAVKMAGENAFDLILLDIMLPGMDGFDVIKQIGCVPVISITAKDGLTHKLNGLKLGADDYIVKPFEMLELLARIDAVLRRTQKNISTFSLDNTVVNLTDRTVMVQVYRYSN